ncbi:MAG: VPLPA-CTERM sorting domain-containing protein [Gammaproteobacteria bacterium]|nr:VPLPA-CTERM sorting domain-containing protein [Gammaproteobacteria bacterium]
MHIFQRFAAVVVLLIPCIANAAVVRPALDIQLFSGDAGAWLTETSSGAFDFDIDATAFAIVFDDITANIDIPNQSFTLHGTYDAGANAFYGSFNVAGGLLSGSFNDLTVAVLSSGSIDFSANLSYDAGSLSTGLTGGRLEGIGNISNLSAKLGPVSVVPVPAAVWLFGSGLIALVGLARRKA